MIYFNWNTLDWENICVTGPDRIFFYSSFGSFFKISIVTVSKIDFMSGMSIERKTHCYDENIKIIFWNLIRSKTSTLIWCNSKELMTNSINFREYWTPKLKGAGFGSHNDITYFWCMEFIEKWLICWYVTVVPSDNFNVMVGTPV